MREGAFNNPATRMGQAPQRRHVRCAWLISTQTASDSGAAACSIVSINADLAGSQAVTRTSAVVDRRATTLLICTPLNAARDDDVTEADIYAGGKGNGAQLGKISTISDIWLTLRAAGNQPPWSAAREARTAGLPLCRPRYLMQDRGCRRAPAVSQTPVLRRRLSPLETGRYAPAGCRYRVLDRQTNPVIHLHVRPPSEQAQQ